MACLRCKTQSVYEFTNKTRLCKDCFTDYFERKVFKTIRKYQMSMQNIEGEKNDVRYKILKIISGKAKINRKMKTRISAGIKNLNDFSTEIIAGIMKKEFNAKKFLPKTKNEEFPLYFISDKEILLYAGLKNLKGRIRSEKKNAFEKNTNILFSEIERNDPDVRHAVVNALTKAVSIPSSFQ